MTYVACSVKERFVNPLFEVFDGGDFVLSSYRDVEEPLTRMRVFLPDPSAEAEARAALQSALDVIGVQADIEKGEIPDEDWRLSYRRHFTVEEIGRRLVTLLRHDINYVAMHTNFDVCGMADAAAEKLKLQACTVLDVTYEEADKTEGIGRTGSLAHAMTLKDCALQVKEAFGLPAVRVFGDIEKEIKTAALCPGSGKSVIGTAIDKGADVLITGDIDHHEGIDAVAEGLAIIDAGHYGIEKIFVDYMETFLREHLPALTVIAAAERHPFITI